MSCDSRTQKSVIHVVDATEPRRDQEEGVELDSHKEALRRDQEQGGGAWLVSWTSFASFVSQWWSYRHCLCDSVLHSSWDSN